MLIFLNRKETIEVFHTTGPNSPTVMLLSLKAGGVGLNLTSANHLLLMDPAWNPAAEWQCFDRIHRMGQTKDVFIYKFITVVSFVFIHVYFKKNLNIALMWVWMNIAIVFRKLRLYLFSTDM